MEAKHIAIAVGGRPYIPPMVIIDRQINRHLLN